jgi:hypothetical protein
MSVHSFSAPLHLVANCRPLNLPTTQAAPHTRAALWAILSVSGIHAPDSSSTILPEIASDTAGAGAGVESLLLPAAVVAIAVCGVSSHHQPFHLTQGNTQSWITNNEENRITPEYGTHLHSGTPCTRPPAHRVVRGTRHHSLWQYIPRWTRC